MPDQQEQYNTFSDPAQAETEEIYMKRTYTAYHGHTEFTFESEHRAGSAANMEDAKAAARRRFGKPSRGYEHAIDGITLYHRKNDIKPMKIAQEDLNMSAEELSAVYAAIESGKLTRIGVKMYGIESLLFIKDAHGWTRSQLQRAIEAAFYNR